MIPKIYSDILPSETLHSFNPGRWNAAMGAIDKHPSSLEMKQV